MKYLEYDEYGNLSLKGDELAGKINYSNDKDTTVLEADGREITMSAFWNMLETFEGFEFEFKIKE